MSDRPRGLDLTRSARANGLLAWALIAFVLGVGVASVLTGELLWAGVASIVAVLALVPTILQRDPRVMLPWEVLALAVLPLVGRTIAAESLAGSLATYLAVAAVALIIAVELDTFTRVRMSTEFAVTFVVVATLATAGIWAVTRWSIDVTMGTTFLLETGRSSAEVEHALMWEFVYSTVAGVVGGIVFELYFRRRRLGA